MKQLPNETIDSFHMHVKEEIICLDLTSLTKEEIIDLITLAQLANNCNNGGVQRKQLKDGLKLSEFLDTPRTTKRAELQATEINADSNVNPVQNTDSNDH